MSEPQAARKQSRPETLSPQPFEVELDGWWQRQDACELPSVLSATSDHASSSLPLDALRRAFDPDVNGRVESRSDRQTGNVSHSMMC
jgi:hypothetical protein